jgi:hypothetical protein
MATRTEDMNGLLDRYMGALRYHGDPNEPEDDLSLGLDIRTCANCGEHTLFRLDPAGTWFECTACGHLA